MSGPKARPADTSTRLDWPNYDSLSVVYPRGVCADFHASRDRKRDLWVLSAVYGLVAWWAAEGRDAKSIEPARALRLQRSVPRSCRDPFTAVIRWTRRKPTSEPGASGAA
jgi:hypothetical protein